MNGSAEITRENVAVGIEHQLHDVEEVASILGVSSRSVWRLVASGELPEPLRVGRCARWPLSDIYAYLDRIKRQRDASRCGGKRWSHD
jgi:excisionase family DNA binding protein